MPSIAVHATELPYTKDTVFDWLRRHNWKTWYGLSDETRSEEEPADLQDVELGGVGRSFGTFWSGATRAALNAQLRYTFEAASAGNDALDDIAIPTGNDLPYDLAVITGYRDRRDEILRAYNQALTVWIAERETGSEEQLLAEFRGALAHFSGHISERLQGFVSRYEHCSPDLEAVPPPAIIEVKRLVSWLSQQDDNMYATVTDDGILALEATLASVGRLFVEVDRTGAVEATIVSAEFGIRGLEVTTISELTSVPIASLIGGP